MRSEALPPPSLKCYALVRTRGTVSRSGVDLHPRRFASGGADWAWAAQDHPKSCLVDGLSCCPLSAAMSPPRSWDAGKPIGLDQEAVSGWTLNRESHSTRAARVRGARRTRRTGRRLHCQTTSQQGLQHMRSDAASRKTHHVFLPMPELKKMPGWPSMTPVALLRAHYLHEMSAYARFLIFDVLTSTWPISCIVHHDIRISLSCGTVFVDFQIRTSTAKVVECRLLRIGRGP